MLLDRHYDFKSLVLSFFATAFVLAFFLCTIASVIVKARDDRAARLAAIERETAAAAVVLKPLKKCRFIVVMHPSGEMQAGDPGTPSTDASSP
jgi:hypothetical protein